MGLVLAPLIERGRWPERGDLIAGFIVSATRLSSCQYLFRSWGDQ